MTRNEIIAAYLAAKDAEAAAKKQADAMKKLILDFMGSALVLETDVYHVFIEEKKSVRIDTDSLYKDFPDIKNDYGKVSVSRSVKAVPRSAATEKTA